MRGAGSLSIRRERDISSSKGLKPSRDGVSRSGTCGLDNHHQQLSPCPSALPLLYDVAIQEQTASFGVLMVDRFRLQGQDHGAGANQLQFVG